MHIAEGYLPLRHAAAWTVAAAPFVVRGARQIAAATSASPTASLSFGAAGGFTLLLSSLKLPSVAGSSSHPTGVALGAIACGPAVMAAISCPVLLLQALLLAHGGLTTLGANTIAMGVVGPWTSWAFWRVLRRASRDTIAIGVATVAGTLATYLTTAFQLALAFPDVSTGVPGAFVKFASVFMLPQLPLAIAEAWFTIAAFAVLGGRQLVASEGSHAQ